MMASRKREERTPTQPELAITWEDESPRISDVRPRKRTSGGAPPRGSLAPSLEQEIVGQRLGELMTSDPEDSRTTAPPPKGSLPPKGSVPPKFSTPPKGSIPPKVSTPPRGRPRTREGASDGVRERRERSLSPERAAAKTVPPRSAKTKKMPAIQVTEELDYDRQKDWRFEDDDS